MVMKNRLDEMQEQKLLKIEHNGCWLAFCGLLIAIFVQMLLYGNDFKSIAGEWFVFMCLTWYIAVSCIRNGIWDRKLSPEPKTNLKASLIAGIVTGLAFFCIKYREYQLVWGAVASGIFIFFVTFGACFAGLTFVAHLYRKRTDRLESGEEETDEHGKE